VFVKANSFQFSFFLFEIAMALLLEQVKKLHDAGLLSNIRITVGFCRLCMILKRNFASLLQI
jgi:hypothetical protein